MAGSKAKTALIVVNMIAVILSLVVIGLAMGVMFSSGIPVVGDLPKMAVYGVIVFSCVVFLVSLLGLLGGCFHNKISTIVFVVLNLLMVLLNILGFAFVLSYGNGVPTVSQIDDAARQAQLDFQDELTKFAINNPEDWLFTQETLLCCGVDFRATYFDYASLDVESFADFNLALHSREDCAEGRAEIADLHDLHSEYTTTGEEAVALNEVLNAEANFFCKNRISTVVMEYTKYIAGFVALLVVTQLITIVAAFYLLCKVEDKDGGFQPNKEENAGDFAGTNGKPQADNYQQQTFA
jgi:hypothetical protein